MAKSRRSPSLRFKMRKHRWWILGGCAMVLVAAFAVGRIGADDSDLVIRTQLEDEFAGTYEASRDQVDGPTVEVDLVASPTEIEVQEGKTTEVWALNGTVPGEQLRVKLGETLRVSLQNELPVETTLHWHGVRLPNAMDGVPGVTQEAVAPGASFTYEFTPPDAGTFFYHSHTNSTEQLERGLYGSLVVEDEISTEYSQDITWVIDDWSLTEAGAVDPNFNDPTDTQHNGRWGNVITINGSINQQLNARPGERVRLRMINASVARVYALRFVEPEAQLIAVDGLYTREPTSADATVISPGGRIDVDIVIPDRPGTYEIFEDFSTTVITLATIVVEGEPVDTPAFLAPTNPKVPIWAEADQLKTDIEFDLALQGGRWTINDRAFPEGDTYDIETGRFTKVRFTNESLRLHPMHLHGQFFKVLARNGEPVDEGFFRDSVLLFRDDVVDVGLIALDEGTWAMHCHILEHAAAGMLTLVEVGPAAEP